MADSPDPNTPDPSATTTQATSNVPATTTSADVTTTTSDTQTLATRSDNPFRAIAILIRSLRSSLEGSKTPEQAPRWVRIVRVREFQDPVTGEADMVAKGVIAAIGGFGQAIAYIQKFILVARDLLTQGDAAKALVEVSAEFLKTATSKEFVNSLEEAVGQQPSDSSPLEFVGKGMDVVVKVADKVPSPEDLDVIGRELYLLQCVVQLEGGTVEPKTEVHVDIAKTGKLRLVQWGFAQKLPLFNLGKDGFCREILPAAHSVFWARVASGRPTPRSSRSRARESGAKRRHWRRYTTSASTPPTRAAICWRQTRCWRHWDTQSPLSATRKCSAQNSRAGCGASR